MATAEAGRIGDRGGSSDVAAASVRGVNGEPDEGGTCAASAAFTSLGG